MNTQKAKLGYTINQTRNGHYSHLYIEVREIGHSFREFILTFKLQTDDGTGRLNPDKAPEWYGLHTKVKGRIPSDIKQINAVAQKTESILNEREGEWSLRNMERPENILWALEKQGIRRMVYDGRVSQYVPLSELAGPEFRAFHNNHESVLARDESEAKRLLTVKTAQFSPSALQSWLNEGSPVMLSSMSDAPSVQATESVLTPCFVVSA